MNPIKKIKDFDNQGFGADDSSEDDEVDLDSDDIDVDTQEMSRDAFENELKSRLFFCFFFCFFVTHLLNLFL